MTTQTGVQSFTEAGSCAEHTTQTNTRADPSAARWDRDLVAQLTSSRNLSSNGRTGGRAGAQLASPRPPAVAPRPSGC